MTIRLLSKLLCSRQAVLHVRNLLTGSETALNPLRSRRPLPAPERDPRDFVGDFLRSTAGARCDFCNYRTRTAEDDLGRWESPCND